ncbi:radical SAM protein [Roseivirga sp. BDSF3-8]|uniref:B12-binding domain-containing radical SAM protein n=1 Tax=Roseivirga sp. BDSF3-8 TaxID=3241598 RepID=UPI003531E2EB
MKSAIIISFDLIRPGELTTSLAIGSLLAYAKSQPEYGEVFTLQNISINAFDVPLFAGTSYFHTCLGHLNLTDPDTIAISAYVWSEQHVHTLCAYLRQQGFGGKIVLGGYQVTYGNDAQLATEYPECDIFISGYAEKALVQAILADKPDSPMFLSDPVNFAKLPSPYLTGELDIPMEQPMLRMETKRGCPYRCTFCAHRDLKDNQVHKNDLDKVFAELALFKERKVKRVNVLDPVFNMGSEYLEVLEEVKRLGMPDTTFTFQARFESIHGINGDRFLGLAEDIRAHLEFGVQTIIEEEFKVVGRPNKPDHITRVFAELNRRSISYEVSLIYGLPNQTPDTFRRSIAFLQDNGCTTIKAFPLMLLKGTELYDQKQQYALHEEVVGEFGIQVVTSGNSFTKDDWLEMKELAQNLSAIPERL